MFLKHTNKIIKNIVTFKIYLQCMEKTKFNQNSDCTQIPMPK